MASIRERLGGAWKHLRGRSGGPVAWEAGRLRQRDPDFVPMQIGPNALADQHLDMARRRVRWLVDNHPLIHNARNIFVNNIVGDAGIMIQPATAWEELNKILEDRWYQFWEAVDIGREMSGAQSQRQLCEEMFAGGDSLVYSPIAPRFGDEPMGPAVELIAAEQLDLVMNAAPSSAGGSGTPNRVRQGVEFDALGRRVAFHVYEDHPSDGWAFTHKTRRIPADAASLAMFRPRPSQVRGVPVPIAAVQATRMQDLHEDAYMALSAAAACVALYFEGVDTSKISKGSSGPINMATGQPLVSMSPGMVGGGPASVKPTLMSTNTPPPQYGQLQQIMAMRMAAGSMAPYSEMTGDYGDATFSSERARQLAFRKAYKPCQVAIAQAWNRPVYRTWLRWEITFNNLPLTAEQRKAWEVDRRQLYARRDIMPGWEWVNPQQDAAAAEIELSIGTASRQDICAAKGKHWKDVIDQEVEVRKYEMEKEKEAGLPPRAAAPVRPVPQDVPQKTKPATARAGRMEGILADA